MLAEPDKNLARKAGSESSIRLQVLSSSQLALQLPRLPLPQPQCAHSYVSKAETSRTSFLVSLWFPFASCPGGTVNRVKQKSPQEENRHDVTGGRDDNVYARATTKKRPGKISALLSSGQEERGHPPSPSLSPPLPCHHRPHHLSCLFQERHAGKVFLLIYNGKPFLKGLKGMSCEEGL